ncbi:hypothetical protein L486_03695 [Kwoniella mangroviensis CBS 10435]|uniref:Transcription initiation factor TFIID subunit 8 n=1 Tax=Kwoniella mangroviensis CBS 10435 TaxID=1331196 RepID=A0A1B9IUK2_9TREE|nr:hypothetical protein L486_03695 [Kwoniella mangroviensis CBS 10435]OCF76554.1 hypothetical protein I204_02251 [Kwoniella mangroviensis CBS 8886]
MSTMRSQPSSSTSNYLPPDVPQAYVRQVIVNLLLKRGFEGAEAGALTEIERLLEHHITNLFEESLELAHLSGRREANAIDLVAAQEESGWGVKRMKRESKRKRGKAPDIPYDPSSSTPSSPTFPTLSSLLDEQHGEEGEDIKPDFSSTAKAKGRGIKPAYSQEWFPVLPEKWTMVDADASDKGNHTPNKEDQNHNHNQPIQVTSALLDFIKLTATERGDIPPELGVVNYNRVDDKQDSAPMDGLKEMTAGKGLKRKWGVKGVSARS